MTQDSSNSTVTSVATPCSPSELKRFKIASWVVFALSGLVFAMIMTFGNAPRSFVDRMNLILGPIVIVDLSICAYSLWRFRKACVAWQDERHSNISA